MQSAVLSLHYLPDIAWFRNYLQFQNIYIEKHENFVKSTGRNRCDIAAANGRHTLTIPLAGGRDHHSRYVDTKIAYTTNWQDSHWYSIKSAYGSAPYFEFYAHIFQKFYEKKYEFLFDFNLELLAAVLSILKAGKTFHFTIDYEKIVNDKIDLRSERNTPGHTTLLRYLQVFEERHGFISNLSIIDLIFNLGPQAQNYLYQMAPLT